MLKKSPIDRVDAMILAELDRDCRIPATRLAKKVKKSRQTVEYRINNLRKEGIITSFNAAINPHAIGLKLYKIYFKLRNLPEEKQRLFALLKSMGNVYWMGECAGSWDLIVAFFVRNDQEFFQLKNTLLAEYTDLIIDEEGQILVDVQQYPKMYFTKKRGKPTLFAGELRTQVLDSRDHIILSEIVNNGRVSLVDLVRKTRSTVPAIKRRLKKLIENGVIIQFRIGVDLSKLGLELYKTIIKFERYSKNDEKKLRAYVAALPQTQYFITNMWNVELEFVVKNFHEYHTIIENLKAHFPQVIKTVDSMLMITDDWTPGFKNIWESSITPSRSLPP